MKIQDLPVEFVRSIDEHLDKHGSLTSPGMSLFEAPLFRIRKTFPLLTNHECAELWVEWLGRHDDRKRGRGIAAAALVADVTP